MSQSLDKILPPLPKPTMVGDLIPVTVLVPTVKPFCDQDFPVLVLGLNFGPVEFKGENAKQTVQVSRFKTFGKSDDGQDINHDGISDVKEGGLKLEIEHGRMSSGTSKVYCKLI